MPTIIGRCDLTSHSAIEDLLARLAAGDSSARALLLERTLERLTALGRRMLKGFAPVHRWESTDDVVQNAALRLWSALAAHPPATPLAYYRLACLNLRRELIDLSRHYGGPQGHGAHHASAGSVDPSQTTWDPGRLALWTEFHEGVAALPDNERILFDLLWYQNMTLGEAATILGEPERTVRRRWRALRIRFARQFDEDSA